MSVSKWLLSAVIMSMASQLSFAGDLPVSVSAVLVPSDSACNACKTGKPLYVNSLGIGIYPSDESCRKCEANDSLSSESQAFLLSKEADFCIIEMNNLYTARYKIRDHQEECKKPLVKETRSVLVNQLDLAKIYAQNTITACTPVYEKQTQERKKTYADIIELAKTTLAEIDAFAKDTLDADPNYCMPQEE
jgi:hypothetical protein